jgi:hypothetical protein
MKSGKAHPEIMTYKQLNKIILSAGPGDWLDQDEEAVFVCKKDLNIRLTRGEREPSIFAEDWAKDFPDRSPHRLEYSLWYGASLVKVYDFVSVDGARADLPLPKINTMEITPEQYAIAHAVNFACDVRGSYFREYIQRFYVVESDEEGS